MAQKKQKKEYRVGDKVTAGLLRLSRDKKVKVKGRIKSINYSGYGKIEYVITGGKVEDFSTRIIE